MRQIVYFSTASQHQDALTVAGILAISRNHNLREKITGLLVAGGHRYLQVFEGPAVTVEELMGRIQRDHRHVGATVLVNRKISERSFSGWSMAYFEEPKLGEYETFTQLIDRMRAELPERKLRDQIDCFERRFAVAALAPAASPWTLAKSYDAGLTLDRSH